MALAIAVASSLVAVALARQPTTAPAAATAPSTRPVTVDLTSPKSTLLSLGKAFEEGDVDAVLACCDVGKGERLIREMTPLMKPSYQLDALLREKFGEGLDHMPMIGTPMRPDEIKDGTVEETGDTAVVKVGQETFPMQRRDGRWRMTSPESAEITDAEIDDALAEMRPEYERTNVAVDAVIQGVKSGRFADRKAAEAELKQRLAEADSAAPRSPTDGRIRQPQ